MYTKNPQSVMIKVFNSGYLIALLLFLAASAGSLCDGVIASRSLGVVELAAIGLIYPYTKAMECISLMFASGAQVVIGRKIGQNQFDEVSRVFYTSMTFAVILSVLIFFAVCTFANPIARLFGAVSEEILKPTVDYLVILAAGAPAHLLTLYLIPLFQLDEKKKLINIATIVMTLVNVSLNILFVINHMGIRGIGLSTTISYYVAVVILSTHFFEKKQGILLQGKFAFSRKYLLETIREGTPAAFKSVTSIAFNMAVSNILAIQGSTEALAAFSLYKMTKFVFLSVSEAIINPVRMIQSMLREERDRRMLREIFLYSVGKGLILSTLLSSVLWLFGRGIYAWLVSEAVLDETVSLMQWATIVFILNTFVCYYLAYFQAIKKNIIVYSISVVMNLVALPVFYLLSRSFGSRGVWMSFAVQFVIVTLYVVGCALYMGRKNKGIVNKLLVLPVDEDTDYTACDFHIQSEKDAEAAVSTFSDLCEKRIASRRKSYYCCLALEEIVFNILECQKANHEQDPNIDVHILFTGNEKMEMRIKDCSRERNPFAKYEYSKTGDELENLGIRMVKSFADEVKYSFIYGVNFITITINRTELRGQAT